MLLPYSRQVSCLCVCGFDVFSDCGSLVLAAVGNRAVWRDPNRTVTDEVTGIMGGFFCSVEVLNISFPAVKAVNQTASAAVDGSENSTINTRRLSKSSELCFYSNL